MSNENPGEDNKLSDQHDPISKSQINFYIDEEDKNINRITIISKDDEEITLFPMKLESGEEYMPNLNEYIYVMGYDGEDKERKGVENDNETPLFFSLRLKEVEMGMYLSIMADDSNLSFLEFARNNLSVEEYARFIMEQEAVQERLIELDRKGEVTDEVYNKDFKALIMYWPKYYPRIENYDCEFLPTTEELYPAYLFNKLAYILSHREEDDNLEVERFDIKELDYLKSFIQKNYGHRHSPIYSKITEYNSINTMRRSSMFRYIETWYELLMIENRKNGCFEDLKNISRW
jgi:hypothetical protein